jgi:hypothetical protein
MGRLLSLLLLCALAPSVHAATVSGSLSPAYGAPLVVQTTQSQQDALYGSVSNAQGSELDAGYAYVANDTLYLFLTGNVQYWIQLEGGIVHVQPLYVFLDTRPGGQNILSPSDPNVGPAFDIGALQGLSFDPGFEADYCFGLTGDFTSPQWYMAELATGGGGVASYLGRGPGGAPGTLSGGTNPFNIAATINDSNIGGVSQGCGASSGAGVPTGMEWAIPMAAIGHPSDCIKVSAFFLDFNSNNVLNQVLGPLPPGTCGIGPANIVQFGTIPGNQYFAFCPNATPTRGESWGALKSHYR